MRVQGKVALIRMTADALTELGTCQLLSLYITAVPPTCQRHDLYIIFISQHPHYIGRSKSAFVIPHLGECTPHHVLKGNWCPIF